MRQTLDGRLRMVYTGDEGQELMRDTEMGLDVADTLCLQLGGARRKMTWRQFILVLGLHTHEEMGLPGADSLLCFHPDPVRRLCHRMISCSISGREQAPQKRKEDGSYVCPGEHFIGRLRTSLWPVYDQWLRGCRWFSPELLLIDLHELGRLNIYERIGDTWAWVAPGPERKPNAAAGAPKVAEDGPAVHESASADPIPMQTPQPPPTIPRTMPQRIARLEEEAFDISLVGSSQLPYQRRTRRRTGDASTSSSQ
ncbi:hypothetical protein Tco_0636700 [Tanacetum coccineum]